MYLFLPGVLGVASCKQSRLPGVTENDDELPLLLA